MRFNHRSVALHAGAALAFVAVLSACSISGSGYGPAAHPSYGTFITSTSGAVSLPLLTASAINVSGSAPSANAAVRVTESLSATAPDGLTALKVRRDSSDPVSVLLYVTFSSTSSVTLTGSPSITFTSSSIASGTSYSLGEVSGSGTWTAPFAGPETASGDSVSFASVSTPVTIAAGSSITFALYSGSLATPTPTPTPVASPASLTFDATNPTPMPFSVSETGYSGAFDATMSCTENPSGQQASPAYVAQFSNATTSATETPASAGAAATFTVDGGAETGSCTATVTDSNNNSVAIAITVSSTGVTIQRVRR